MIIVELRSVGSEVGPATCAPVRVADSTILQPLSSVRCS